MSRIDGTKGTIGSHTVAFPEPKKPDRKVIKNPFSTRHIPNGYSLKNRNITTDLQNNTTRLITDYWKKYF